NITANQARDWLVQQHPADLALDPPGASPRLLRRAAGDGEEPEPSWLADYGLEGQGLSDELIEEQLVPAAQRRVGQDRLHTLATMVLLGMNRVNVRDGSISARVRFRASARDQAQVTFAASNDPGSDWGKRGSATYDNVRTMISTVGVNAQAGT